MSNATLLVSIVVPVYNVEGYIQTCVDSLLAQTHANLEVLLVDDGSTDNSGLVCDNAAARDKRVRVIHKKNGGLSDARNAGIREARGQYLALVDGDDYVHKEFIEILLGTAQEHQADISVCSFIRVYHNKIEGRESKERRFAKLSNVQAVRDMMSPSTLCDVVAWNKLYRTKLFKDNAIQYPLGKIHEDTFTTYKLLFHANKVVFVDKPLYHYVQRVSSIMGVGYSRKNLAMVEAIDEMAEWADREHLPLQREIFHFRLSKTLYLISRMADASATTAEDWAELSSWIARHKKEALFGNQYVDRMQKMIICFVLLGKRPYATVRWLLRHMQGYTLSPIQ